VTVVHWARHGENVANLARRFSYRIFDGDLTGRGIAQAENLAAVLERAGRDYGVLACSPLLRARQTAAIVSARLGLPVTLVLEDLREVNVGELDGRDDDAAWEQYNAVLAGWRSGQLGLRFPGGESGTELATRIGRALATVAGQAGSADGIVIGHGANIRAAVPVLTGRPDPGTDLDTGAVARFAVAVTPGPATCISLIAWN
jgi:broad specificity phosphatase PhoE